MKKSLFICVIGLMLFSIQQLFAQEPLHEKRIYLIDISASMIGEGSVETPNIFEDVKSNLTDAISAIKDDATEIVIIPFTDKPLAPYQNTIKHKRDIIKYIKNIAIQEGNTNINAAWTLGTKQIDKECINYMFLLTDGLHNSGANKKTLDTHIARWNNTFNQTYAFGFYVTYTPNASEVSFCDVIDTTRNLWVVKNLNLNSAILRTKEPNTIKKNIRSSKTIDIRYKTNNPKAKLDKFAPTFAFAENPYYEISDLKKLKMRNAYRLTISPKKQLADLPSDTIIPIIIQNNQSDYPFVFFNPSVLYAQMVNHELATATMTCEKKKSIFRKKSNQTFGKETYNEPFMGVLGIDKKNSILAKSLKCPLLSWAVDDTSVFEQTYIIKFNERAIHDQSMFSFKLTSDKMPSDDLVSITYNGESVKEYAVRATTEPQKVVIRIKMNPDVKRLNLAGGIVSTSHNIDQINKVSIDSEDTQIAKWSAKHRIMPAFLVWLLWLLIVAIAILLLILIYKLIRCIYYIISKVNIPKNKGENNKPSREIDGTDITEPRVPPIILHKHKKENQKNSLKEGDKLSEKPKKEDVKNEDSIKKEEEKKEEVKKEEEKKEEVKKEEEKNEEEYDDDINFYPWVGRDYGEKTSMLSNQRVLVIGDHHYFDGEKSIEELRNITTEIIQDYIDGKSSFEGYKRTYSNFDQALYKKGMTAEERKKLWNHIVFYNYIQQIVLKGNKPTLNDYIESKDALDEILAMYCPNKVIVWGRKLSMFLKSMTDDVQIQRYKGTEIESWTNTLSNGQLVEFMYIHQPSMFFNINYWHNMMSLFLNNRPILIKKSLSKLFAIPYLRNIYNNLFDLSKKNQEQQQSQLPQYIANAINTLQTNLHGNIQSLQNGSWTEKIGDSTWIPNEIVAESANYDPKLAEIFDSAKVKGVLFYKDSARLMDFAKKAVPLSSVQVKQKDIRKTMKSMDMQDFCDSTFEKVLTTQDATISNLKDYREQNDLSWTYSLDSSSFILVPNRVLECINYSGGWNVFQLINQYAK